MIDLFEVSLPSGESEEDLQLLRYALTHNLKGSLRPIQGFGHYLDRGEVSSAQAGELQRKMVQAGADLERQLDALADYAKICLRPSRLEELDLSWVLQSVVKQQLARFHIGQKCVSLAETIPPVVADRGILELVFSELISNALLFTPAHQLPCVKVTSRRQGDRVETSIQDCGLGIPSGCLELLGKPFQRFHSEAHLVPGVGLGLTRALRGLAALQGRLHCSSETGQGSLLLVSLRAA